MMVVTVLPTLWGMFVPSQGRVQLSTKIDRKDWLMEQVWVNVIGKS